MKLVRYGTAGEERPGLIDGEGKLRDLGAVIEDVDGTTLSPESLAKLQALDPSTLPEIGGNPRLGPPVNPTRVGKLVCVGLNYSDHAVETGNPIPSEPVLFMKATSSITGPYDPVVLPRGSVKTDWEVELAFVIGKRAKYVSEAEAMDHVAGFCVMNDVSERTYQLERGGQWTKGKSCDTYGPMGPWLVTPDEVGDISNLKMWLDVDGKRYQDGTTATMIFSVPTVIAYMSQMFTLEPGDVVTTGTPPGVGAGMKPPVFLRAGQTMVTGIDKLGEMQNPVRADD
ncbi:MAG: FAA hydrolase family protein [Geminicoccaceae bacterium]|nr:MAG: FAA hydrolase family protein [Geminicoccaceae bacterium]